VTIRAYVTGLGRVTDELSSHMTPEMGKMVDEVVGDALRGSGFSFADSTTSSH
jgi:hypothetical protein